MKKGFTLIELLAVIILLGVLLGFVTPSLINMYNNSKENLYDSKVKSIESAAKSWGYDYIDYISTSSTNPTKITVDTLISGNKSMLPNDFPDIEKIYLDPDDEETLEYINPVTNEKMNDCEIEVYYNDNETTTNATANRVIVNFLNNKEGCSK